MHIERIRITDFPGIADGEFDLGDGTKTVVITGPQGSGKTSFLRAVSVAKEGCWAYGASFDSPTLADGRTARIGASWGFTTSEVERFGLGDSRFEVEVLLGSQLKDFADVRLQSVFGIYDPSPLHPKVELFHAERWITAGGSWPQARRPSSVEVALRLRSDNRKYCNLSFFAVEAFEMGRGEELSAAFAALCPTARLASAKRTSAGAEVRLSVRDTLVPLEEASASEREAFLFATTFLRSGLSGSVVLIDGPERFLTASHGSAFVDALRGLGAGNQLIIATQSSELAAKLANVVPIRLKASDA